MPNSSRNKTAVADGISLTTASWRIPFRSIEPLVWGLDCIIILTSSILSGFAYHRWVLGSGGDLETSLAVGLLVAAEALFRGSVIRTFMASGLIIFGGGLLLAARQAEQR